MNRAERLARLLRVLAAIIAEPGLNPLELADRAGVSERTLRRDLAQLHCDQAQGYFLTRPLPAAAFESWLKERPRLITPTPVSVAPAQSIAEASAG